MKVATVIGARPQFIKAAPVSRILRRDHTEIFLHTGQHYDVNMSTVFFHDLDLPPPQYNLAVGSASHGAQTGAMLAKIESVLLSERPDLVLIYGDTNSTVAGALAAAKLQINVAHVEAGLRSFNRAMPEEINRIVSDHVSNILFCPSQTAVGNLAAEGITRGVYMVGDVMLDALKFCTRRSQTNSDVLSRLRLSQRSYMLATLHRAENTDKIERLRTILQALLKIGRLIVFPVHPRTRKLLQTHKLIPSAAIPCQMSNLLLIDPVGYLDMVSLEQHALMILTDSGGVQKEAYWLSVPCTTLRDETEWVETLSIGWNVLAGVDADRIVEAATRPAVPTSHPPLYGSGHASEHIVSILESQPCLTPAKQ